MEIVVNSNTIIGFAAFLTALGVIIGLVINIFRQFNKWNSYDEKIKSIKEEQYLQLETLFAVLDGLHQMGCNGKTTEASQKLDDYLKRKAHEVETKV